MRLIAVSVLGLALVGCSSSGFRPEQEVSIKPYADRIEAACLTSGTFDRGEPKLSDSLVQKACSALAITFADINESNMKSKLSSTVIELCKEKYPEQETACIIWTQENYYENNANKMIQSFQAKQ